MAYATIEDVALILPDEEEVPTEAEERLQTNLEEATDLVIAYLGHTYDGSDVAAADGVPDDVPGAVRRVVARVALRVFMDIPDNPGAEAETNLMGPFSHSINWSREAQARDLYLTESDKMRLNQYQTTSSRGVYHVPMVGAGGYESPWWE